MITFNNTGTAAITVTQIWVNNVQVPTANISPALGPDTPANSGVQWTVTLAGTGVTGNLVTSGDNYQVQLVSAKGNKFISSGSAPS